MRRILWRAGLAAAVVALVAGAFAVYRAVMRPSAPADVVRAYYAALAIGDAPAALALGDVPAGSHALLTSTVLREQLRIAGLTSVSTAESSRNGSSAQVFVRYELHFVNRTRQLTDVVALHRTDGRWRLDRTAAATTLRLDRAAQRATILGTAMPTAPTLLFPGAVPVRFDSPYLRIDPDRDAIGIGAPADVTTLPVQVSDAGRRQIDSTLVAALHSCLASGSSGTCPLPSDRFVPGTVRGTLHGTPVFAVTLDDTSTGVLDIAGHVAVDATYDRLTYKNRPTSGHGVLTLPVHARAYAVAPLRVVWSAT